MAITTSYSIDFIQDLDPLGVELVTDAVSLQQGGVASIGNEGSQSTTVLDYPSGDGQLALPAAGGTGGAVAQLGDGNIVMVSDVGTDIAFDIWTSFGVPVTLGGEFGFAESGPDILNADVAALANGGFVVVYQKGYGNGDNDIGVNIRDAAGDHVISFSIDTSLAVDEAPSITGLANGGFVVTWQRTAGADTELWYAVYNANGSVSRSPSLLDTSGSINGSPAVVALNHGGFAIAYRDNGWTATDTDITLARFDQNGGSLGSTDISQNEIDDSDPSITVLSNGMIMVGSTISGEAGTDVRWTLVSSSNGAILATSDLGSGAGTQGGTAVAGLDYGQFAAFHNEVDENDAVGQLLGVTRTQIGDLADDIIFGDSLRDRIYGGGGTDTIRGGGGADRLFGQGGDDMFDFNSSDLSKGESISGGAGSDTLIVSSSLDFTRVNLASVERLLFQNEMSKFSGPITVTFRADQVGGGLASNLIVDGAMGDDKDIEVIMGKSTSLDLSQFDFDVTELGSGEVIIWGDSSSETIVGSTNRDYIYGSGGNDRITGGGGMDYLRGGDGNDIYTVNAAGEASEKAGEGNDLVRSSVDYTLGADIERLQLLGGADRDGSGNGLANHLIGNAGDNMLLGRGGNDRLNGGAGTDDLRGGVGNDIYIVNAAGEAREAADQGIDTVKSSVSYVLGANLERLLLTGTGDIAAKGNALGNRINGNAGDNVLNGGGGRDRLAGGAGEDAFLFNTVLDALGNVDKIIDFDTAADTIRLDDAIFAGLTNAGRAAAFHVGNNAADASDRIIYNETTGALYFDADGAGGAAKVLFATLDPGLDLQATDFVIV